jgi:aldose sugar dehydrogenase
MIRRLLIVLVALGIAVGCAVATPQSISPTPDVEEETPVGEPTPDQLALAAPSSTVETPSPPAQTSYPAPETPISETPYPPAETPAPPTPTVIPSPTPDNADVPMEPQVEMWVRNLEIPWELVFVDEERALVTERPGRLRLILNGQLQSQPLLTLPTSGLGEGGLMGLALDPDLAQNGYLYVMYTYRDGGALRNRISRFTWQGDQVGGEQVLLNSIPGARIHNGGRLGIGPDGKLYATTGDAANPDLAQNSDSLAGKILRMNLDGSVPDDNPSPGSLVYSLGHRNPQGLAWDAETGLLYSTEHGPSGEFGLCCRDELNHIVAGGNYGWPEVTLDADDPRYVDPIMHSGPTNTWAPAGMVVYRGDLLRDWHGNILFANLRGRHIRRVVIEGTEEPRVVEDELLFDGEYGRIRAVVVGPDGALYVTTSNRDGRGQPAADDDRILRIVPSQ